MTTDAEMDKHGFSGLKMQKEIWRIDYQSKVETISVQFLIKFYERVSFIHECNPRFSLQTSLEIVFRSSVTVEVFKPGNGQMMAELLK